MQAKLQPLYPISTFWRQVYATVVYFVRYWVACCRFIRSGLQANASLLQVTVYSRIRQAAFVSTFEALPDLRVVLCLLKRHLQTMRPAASVSL